MKGTWIASGVMITGIVIAGVGILYWRHAQPVMGDEIDRVDCGGATIIVSSEKTSERSFVELHDPDDRILWQALIPHYAGSKGRPAIACGATAATVRVERGGRAEVFGFFLQEGDKIGAFRLAPEHEPITTQPGPITLTDHVKSYEFVGGPDWHQVIAVDLSTGKGVWKTDLGPEPVVAASLTAGRLRIQQAGHERVLELSSGRDDTATQTAN